MGIKIIFDFDDLHWLYPENCIDYIDQFVEDFPEIKLNFFAVPNLRKQPIYMNEDWCSRIRKYVESGNIQIAVHGFEHNHLEFDSITKEEANERLIAAKVYLDKAKLPFVKVFRGPHWGINQNTYEVLIDHGYSHVYTHKKYEGLIKANKICSVIYNWNLKCDYNNMNADECAHPIENNVVVSHGHSWNVCENGISENYFKVSDFIDEHDPELLFLNEYPNE